jgi:excisionase family DNA binding protein
MTTNTKQDPSILTGLCVSPGGSGVDEREETPGLAPVICHQINAEQQRPPWLTAKEAAQYLSVEPRTVLLWARQGKLQGFRLSGTKRHVWRFRHCDLDAMLTEPSVALRTKGAQ